MTKTVFKTCFGLAALYLYIGQVAAQPVHGAETVKTKLYRVAVLLVNYQDAQQRPVSRARVLASTMKNPSGLRNYFREISYGKIDIRATVFDNHGKWYTIAKPRKQEPGSKSCNYMLVAHEALQKAAKDIQYDKFDALMIVASRRRCILRGESFAIQNFSLPPLRTGDAQTLPLSFLNGSLSAMQHEFGHNLGMGHATMLICPGTQILGDDCTVDEYGDPYDVMGNEYGGRPFHVNAHHKIMQGWIDVSQVTTVLESGDYPLTPLETNSPEVKVLKIPATLKPATGEVTGWFYVEYRQRIGVDTSLEIPGYEDKVVTDGVLIHYFPEQQNFAQTTQLLLMNRVPCTENCDRTGYNLKVGRTYSDTATGISFSPVAQTPSTITVRVSVGGFSPKICTKKLAMKANSAAGLAGAERKVSIELKNPNSGCGSFPYRVLVTEFPEGWRLRPTAKIIEVSSGSTLPLSLRISPPKGTVPGKYTITVTAMRMDKWQESSKLSFLYTVRAK